MTKSKKDNLSDKEILIAFCSTLSDKNSKIAYQILTERFDIHRAKHLLFNRNGVQVNAPEGKIRLTSNQYKMVLEELGEQIFHRACELLYDYICNLEERVSYGDIVAKQRLKEYNKITHYYRIMRGWVAQKLEQEFPQRYNDRTLKFEEVSNKKQAMDYINSIPKEYRLNNNEIVFLVTKYGIDANEIN